MPTDLAALLAQKHSMRAQALAHRTILLVCIIICLGVLVLLFTDDGLAQAFELIGEIEF
jgi:hypothetical protein